MPAFDRDSLQRGRRAHARRAAARRLGVVAALTLAGTAVACGTGEIRFDPGTFELGQRSEQAPAWTPTETEPLTIRLEVPDTAQTGTEIPVRVVVHNGSARAVGIGFGERRGFDVLVARATGTADTGAVWSLPKMFSPARDLTVTDPVKPGRDTVFTVVWPGVDDAGQKVPPGNYRVRATVSAELVSTKQLWTEWSPITVRP